jgi:glycosyltransferase involved in cell wall biosynthesis
VGNEGTLGNEGSEGSVGSGEPAAVPVLQWAQEHGEVGGVLTSHLQLTRQLRAEGHAVRYVDTGSLARAAAAVPHLWRRRSLHLFHITRLWRAIVLAPVFAVLPGRVVLVLHSGSVGRQLDGMRPLQARLLRWALAAYDEIWAVNDEIGRRVPAALARRVRVVTPFGAEPLPGEAAAGSAGRDPHLLAVTTNAGLAHYRADLAVHTVALVRETWPDARLRVLAYGHDGPDLAALRDRVAALPWVELTFDSTPDEVHEVLRRTAVFLRPTAWDGDSVVVREALAAGARVVATDSSPRPAGVELSGADARDLADAVLHGARVSDGAGLAATTLLEAARAAMTSLR